MLRRTINFTLYWERMRIPSAFKFIVDLIRVRYRNVLLLYVASRIVVFLTVILARAHGFGKATLIQRDAVIFLDLVRDGYRFSGSYLFEGSYISFFPLYPLLVRSVHRLFGIDPQMAALGISFFAGAVAVCILFELLRRHIGSAAALAAVALLSFFPASVFLSSAYSESTFMALSLLALLCMERGHFRGAMLATALALVTRVPGIVLVPLLAWHLWHSYRSVTRVFLSLAITAIPIVLFLAFQWNMYGTPFAFVEAQDVFWRHHAVFPWIGLWNLLREAFGSGALVVMWRTDAVFVLATGITLVHAWKKIPHMLYAFGLGAYLVTLSQSHILGTPRYMLVVFPLYAYWGLILSRHPQMQSAVIGISSAGLVIATLLFSLSKSFF